MNQPLYPLGLLGFSTEAIEDPGGIFVNKVSGNPDGRVISYNCEKSNRIAEGIREQVL